ncbi:EAL domain-containing protein [Shewanella polaris]|uniref:EAL domain-containing protein n=1 Tax=Shewanella polaris TaxID=2588449 RepID=A0A4Y5YIC6_9GAMM|nr:EAL domain-containing protein [Shewanella polaris]QDE32365.1 EAL domain-containing protein [Shewanella polaris]
MMILNDKKLVNLIKYTPSIVVGFFAITVNIIIIKDNQDKAYESIKSLREDIIETNKNAVKQSTNKASNYILYKKKMLIDELKILSQQRVNEAYAIATNIYNNNQNKPKTTVTKLITDALRPIRFYEGRGYFFIFQMDGINVLHGLKPDLEGSSAWDAQDLRGSYILREHINLIKQQNGEAFYHWWYQKPGEALKKEYEKIGFGKYFDPYDWFIGTGEYVSDIEDDLQISLLKSVMGYEHTKNENLFIIDGEGNLLANETKDNNLAFLINSNSTITEKMATQAQFEGNFITFNDTSLNQADINSTEIAYIRRIKDWNWIVGSYFDSSKVNNYIKIKEQEAKALNQKKLTNVIILSAFSTLFMVGSSLIVSNLIARRFHRFQQRIEHNIHALEASKSKLHHMALHDALTGLSNRILLLEKIYEAIESANIHHQQVAIVFIDIDDFKKVNDCHGHSAGDELLKAISEKFKHAFESKDTISRFGGDEFVFCFPQLNNLNEAYLKVAQIQQLFDEKFIVNGREIMTQCSIGVSMYPSDDSQPEGLIRKADIVLYKSKAELKGSATFYNYQLNEQIQYKYLLEEELRRALDNEEIFLLYQPQIDTKTQQLIAVEALARWEHPKLGSISPDDFICIAEEIGIIKEIGLFVFRQVCTDILSVSPAGKNAINVSINISPKQLMSPDFIDLITQATDEIGIDRHRITLEITENVMLNELEKTYDILTELKKRSFCISLDDFGTGYSSLSYLNMLPFDEVKIDRCFVNNITISKQSKALIKSILAISDAYGMITVAEGVEKKEQLTMLHSLGCNLIQGYYFDKPLTLSTLHNTYLKQ